MTQSPSRSQATEVELPPPGRWTIDPSHSTIGFAVRHMVVSTVRGRFDNFQGTIVVAEDPEQSTVEVTIDVASVNTGDPGRDAHLRSPDFFDVERYPGAHFISTKAIRTGPVTGKLIGDLTLHGVTRSVTLVGEYHGTLRDPFGKLRMFFTASTEIDREEFGLTWNQALESGGLLVSKMVRIELEVQAIRDDD